MLSCLRVEQYKVGVVLSTIPDRRRSPLTTMLNSKVFFCFLLAFTHVFGEDTADAVSNKSHLPIFCYINGSDRIINSINNSELDVNLCTYVLIHGTVNKDDWTIRLARPNWEESISNDMLKLKAANNNLKFIISLRELPLEFSYFPLLAVEYHREFAANAKLFIRKYKFDGIHIDWWYPGAYSPEYTDDDFEDDEDYDSYTLKPTSGNHTEVDSYNDKDNYDEKLNDNDENDKDDEDDDIQGNDVQAPGRKYFLRLIKRLKSQLGEDGSLIAVSIASNENNLNLSYDLANLKSIVDYWIIMAVRSNKDVSSKILQDAPIRTNNPSIGVKATIDSVKKAIGPDFKKIVLAIPFRAILYRLQDHLKENQTPFEKEIERRIVAKAYSGVCTLVKKMKNNVTWSYVYNTTAETPYLIKREKVLLYEDPQSVRARKLLVSETPYFFRRRKVLLYEDPQSVRAKTNLAISEGLGGIMTYMIDMDDLNGSCNENIKYPLLKTVHDTIHSPSSDAWKTYQTRFR